MPSCDNPCKCNTCKHLKQKLTYTNMLSRRTTIYLCQIHKALPDCIVEKCADYKKGEPVKHESHNL